MHKQCMWIVMWCVNVIPKFFRRHSCQTTWESTTVDQWMASNWVSKTEPEIKLLGLNFRYRCDVQENSKHQDLTIYTDGSVTKDQSGWSFAVKQCATTIHELDEDSAASMVSTSSLTMEVGRVTYALCWTASNHTCHHPQRCSELARYKKWKVE